jgi:uncharacterized membrane protein YqaE (UPF0057 family)
MKKILTLLLMAVICLNLNAAVSGNWSSQLGDRPEMKALTPEMVQMQMEQFLSLTPKKYKEMTGQKLTLKQTVQLKAAQKMVKKHMKGEDIPKGLYILAAIFGWAWLIMGIKDDWSGNNWWVNLILSWVLCWIPGVIHAFIKMKEYYPGGGN